MAALPTGTVTFLFTDIEGSTTLLQRLGDRRYAEVQEEHRRLLRAAFKEGNGQEVDRQGDSFLVVFSRAREAVGAAVMAQRSLTKYPWPEGAALRVRMGLHTGEPLGGTSDYVGLDVHRAARVCAAGHGGQILLSQAVEVMTARDLPPDVTLRDMGAHRLKDLREPERLFQVVHPDLPSEFPSLKSLDARPNNLPVELTSFVGRDREKAEIGKLLFTGHLVTLMGPGGAGKTRLALQVAAEAMEAFPDGVWLVELAALSDPALVPQTVASALSVREQPGRSMTNTLRDALRGKSVLVVLDNCEHLVAACAELSSALLRVCPNLRVLATSREALGASGETTWRIPSLSVPDPKNLPPLDRFKEYDAVRLFTDRAVASDPQFAVTMSNAPAVAQVCYRLDGIPLAIELAAARVKVLAVEQIATRLDDRFRLLRGGSRTTMLRQQTLRATMDWSFDLLSQEERALLRRLSVFAGGWTLEAAEAICSGNGVAACDILDLLARLVDKSLVITETQGGEVWYRLLETVRQYGGERLVESNEAADIRGLHRDWYLGLAERADRELSGPQTVQWLKRLETEHDNLRSALEWSKATSDGAEAGLRLVGALNRFWSRRGHWREASEWLEGTLARSDEAPPSLRTKAIAGAAYLAWRLGDYRLAITLAEKGMALCRELGDKETSASFLTWMSVVAIHQGSYERATELCEQALNLGRELSNKEIMGLQLAHLGIIARYVRDYERATTLQNESLALFKEIGDKSRIAFVLRNLGRVALHQGDCGRAAACFGESLILCRERGETWLSEEGLEGFAAVASTNGHHKRAARLLGAADQLREMLGWLPSPPDQADYDECTASTRAALGDSPFSVAWAEGRAMTLEQAIEYALASDVQ
jgi:predicted ATPase/class 3 adenylate cyclase